MQKYFEGIGRRKTAIARVRIFESDGKSVVINNKPVDNFFSSPKDREELVKPLQILQLHEKMGISVKIAGGGLTGWKEAIILGLSRALVKMSEGNKEALRKNGFLTRDPRAVERKKPGLKKARKAPRFSKR